MGTSLIEKLGSIQSDKIVTELNALLDKSHNVRISWWGKRLISIDGYEGSVEIDVITGKYLGANVFAQELTAHTIAELPSPEERLSCYNLWDRVKDLYDESDNALNKTWFVWVVTSLREGFNYNIYLPPIKNLICCGNSNLEHRHYINVEDGIYRYAWIIRNSCFAFPAESFKNFFPDQKPVFAYVASLREGKSLSHNNCIPDVVTSPSPLSPHLRRMNNPAFVNKERAPEKQPVEEEVWTTVKLAEVYHDKVYIERFHDEEKKLWSRSRLLAVWKRKTLKQYYPEQSYWEAEAIESQSRPLMEFLQATKKMVEQVAVVQRV